MPLPNEDTTPPVTNTKRVKVVNLNCVCEGITVEREPGAGDGPLKGPGSTGRQVTKSGQVPEGEIVRERVPRLRRRALHLAALPVAHRVCHGEARHLERRVGARRARRNATDWAATAAAEARPARGCRCDRHDTLERGMHNLPSTASPRREAVRRPHWVRGRRSATMPRSSGLAASPFWASSPMRRRHRWCLPWWICSHYTSRTSRSHRRPHGEGSPRIVDSTITGSVRFLVAHGDALLSLPNVASRRTPGFRRVRRDPHRARCRRGSRETGARCEGPRRGHL